MTVDKSSSQNSLGDPLSRRCLIRSELIQEVIGKSHPTSRTTADFDPPQPSVFVTPWSKAIDVSGRIGIGIFGNYVTFRWE